jgi:6-phosphogluconolactonase
VGAIVDTDPGPIEIRQDAPHAHCYHPLGTNGFALCADLGSDMLYSLRTADGSVVGQSSFPPGSGPRHVAVSEDGSMVYASTELGNLLVAVPADAGTGELSSPTGSVSILPTDYAGPDTTASHIELSPCGNYAYVANRVGVPLDGACEACEEGSISIVQLTPELKLLGVVEIGGKVPRSFCVVAAADEAEARGWLIVGAQESSLLRSFAIGADGSLSAVAQLAMPSPGCVVAAE